MAGRKSSASNIKMLDVDALFGLGEDNSGPAEKVEEVSIDELHPFVSHPFKVLDDGKMQETVESIREHGVICPLIVRPGKGNGYEIIAGHRRKRACELLGLETAPCFIRDLTDEEATIAIYVKNFMEIENAPLPYKEEKDGEEKAGVKPDDRADKNHNSKIVKITNQEFPESQFKNGENHNSRISKITI